jgi:hypothetical protein
VDGLVERGVWGDRNGKGMVRRDSWAGGDQYNNPRKVRVRRKSERNLRVGRGGRNDMVRAYEVLAMEVDW